MHHFFSNIGWYPRIGDPTLVGWFTVVAYLVCSYKSFQVYRHAEILFTQFRQRQRWLWYAICLMLLALGINKQLDLQTFLKAFFRFIFDSLEWYEVKRTFELLFIGVVTIFGISAMTLMYLYYRHLVKLHKYAIIGVCILIVFVLVRASSFHNVELFRGSRFLSEHFSSLIELCGIFMIWLNARYFLQLQRWRQLVNSHKG